MRPGRGEQSSPSGPAAAAEAMLPATQLGLLSPAEANRWLLSVVRALVFSLGICTLSRVSGVPMPGRS